MIEDRSAWRVLLAFGYICRHLLADTGMRYEIFRRRRAGVVAVEACASPDDAVMQKLCSTTARLLLQLLLHVR